MTTPTPIFPVCVNCGEYRGLEHDQERCSTIAQIKTIQAKKDRAKRNRQARKEAMESVGMKRVRGTMGGIYWE